MDNSRFADVNGEFTITAADNTGYSLVFYCGTIGIVNTFGSVLAEFDAYDIPAADVAPVVHGEWVKQPPNPEAMRRFHEIGMGKHMNEKSIFLDLLYLRDVGKPYTQILPKLRSKDRRREI